LSGWTNRSLEARSTRHALLSFPKEQLARHLGEIRPSPQALDAEHDIAVGIPHHDLFNGHTTQTKVLDFAETQRSLEQRCQA
jgi:hypothetical protein